MPEVQGRVFSLRIMLVTASFTLGCATAGPLADRIFEPLLTVNGPLAASVGLLLGVELGRGIGLSMRFARRTWPKRFWSSRKMSFSKGA